MTTDREIAHALIEALDRGAAAVVASVVDTNRSVPRHVGAKLLLDADGHQIGSVGGGEMESQVCAAAMELITTGGSERVEGGQMSFDLLDPAKGDPGVCGGSVSVHLEVFMPNPHLVVIGCGHVGTAVIELAHWLGFRVTALDDRADLADPSRLPDADVVLGGPLDQSLAKAGIDDTTHVVLVTRNVAVDATVLPIVLASPARSVGVMGSARRWATTRNQLADAGVTAEQMDRVVSPIGVDIAAETPAEIALSIMTELVDLRRRVSDPE
jgi:xanthine dehydrogenase accessory factor